MIGVNYDGSIWINGHVVAGAKITSVRVLPREWGNVGALALKRFRNFAAFEGFCGGRFRSVTIEGTFSLEPLYNRRFRVRSLAWFRGYCARCSDGEGRCAFPWYGSVHEWRGLRVARDDGSVNYTVSSVRVPREDWPSNFVEDPESPGLGTFTHCLECGSGKRRSACPSN